jgi:Fe-S oxidoreductase
MMAQKMDLAKELDTRLTRQALYHFDVCTRCNACSDRCHMYVETEDPIHSPAYKLALLRRAYERYHTIGGKITSKLSKAKDLSDKNLKEISSAMFECTRCRRCTAYCPFGIDHAWSVTQGRNFARIVGKAPESLTTMAKVTLARSRNIASYEYLYTLLIKTLENQLCEEIGNPNAEIPIKNYDADVLYVSIAGQYYIDNEKCIGCGVCKQLCPQKTIEGELKKPHKIIQEGCISCGICYKNCKFDAIVVKSPSMYSTIMPAAKIFNKVEEKWSLSLYDAANYNYFLGDIDTAKEVTGYLINEAEELGVKTVVMSESGHGFYIMRHLAQKWFKRNFPFKVKSTAEIMAEYIKEGRLKFDPSRFSKSISYHDPCEVGRNGGIFEEPRFILNHIAKEFVELAPPNREYNWCCGGGGGLVAETEFKDLRMKTGKRKAQQIRETKAKVVATMCENCRSQLTDLNKHYNLGIQVASLMDLVANAIKKK